VKKNSSSWTSSMIKLDQFEPIYNGNTLLHHYADDKTALGMIYNEVMKNNVTDDDDSNSENRYK
jgi:hypothetical protein